MEYDDLLELYGYDEERGLSKLVLEKGIEIEDEYGAITWVAGMVTSTQGGTLDFKVKFTGSAIDSGTWTQTRNRAEMENHMARTPCTAETATVSTRDTHHARIHTMAPPSTWLTLAPTPTSWGLEL